MNNQAIIEFNPKLPKLSANEKAVLKLLVEAAKLIAPIYLDQEKQFKYSTNIYPKDITKREFEEAVKKNSELLSPYTVIEKIEGEVTAIPYHIKYGPFLKPIVEKLEEAARISDNKQFSQALKVQAEALLNGNYEQALSTWIKTKPYILDISIGPIDYFDRLFYGKAAYQSWVGILDVDGTKRLNNYKYIVLNASRRALVPDERVENFEHVRAKTIDEVLLSGVMARSRFVGLNLPMSVNWVKKYGSEITLFNQVNDLRLKEEIAPTFKKLFSPAFREGFSLDDLRRGSLRYVALHELSHSFLYYKNSAKNLQDLFSPIYELTATLLAMRIAGSLLLKGRITNKQLESMIVTFVCRSFYLIESSKKSKLMVNYALGGAIFINFMIKNGAIKQKEGMAIPNFTKIFLSLHELSFLLERVLSTGTLKDAQALVKKYGN